MQRAVYLMDQPPDRYLLHRAVEDGLDSSNKSKPTPEPPSLAIKPARDLFQRISDNLAAVSDTEKAAILKPPNSRHPHPLAPSPQTV